LSSRRLTTVTLDGESLRYIERLLAEGRVRSKKAFVDACLAFGIRYSLDRWRVDSGLFFAGPVRVVILPQKALEELSRGAPKNALVDAGRGMGAVFRSYILVNQGLKANLRANWGRALDAMTGTGLGQFTLKADTVEVQHPALPREVAHGLLEALLGAELEPVDLALDMHLFRLKAPPSSSAGR